MTVTYTSEISQLTAADVEGFFVGWPSPPSPTTLLKLLQQSTARFVALDASGRCVGYITGLSDGLIFGTISSLEVLPEFQGTGIGQELVKLMTEHFSELYALDIVCDPDVQPFYEKCGFQPYVSMVRRNRNAACLLPDCRHERIGQDT